VSDAIVKNRTARAVFLMYHSIADQGPTYLSLPPALFERQLALLRRLGYKSGTIADLAALLQGARLDAPRVFLTFDDGFADNHATARPLLEAYGFGALIFVLPPLVDGGAPLAWPDVEESLERYPATMRSMDWRMVEEMVESGSEIGSHTLTHPRLSQLGDEQLRQELLDARRGVEARLGRCETIAYPFGDYSPRVVAAAADAGYKFGFVVSPLDAEVPAQLVIPRLPVDFRDDERRFRMKLSVSGRRLYLSPARTAVRSLGRSVRRGLGR
jgi:peptidoglycan/xylan/chitin deacetylase (PgdA/CDA1 family)